MCDLLCDRDPQQTCVELQLKRETGDWIFLNYFYCSVAPFAPSSPDFFFQENVILSSFSFFFSSRKKNHISGQHSLICPSGFFFLKLVLFLARRGLDHDHSLQRLPGLAGRCTAAEHTEL